MQSLYNFAVILLLGSGLAQSTNGTNNTNLNLQPGSTGEAFKLTQQKYMVHINVFNEIECGGALIAKSMVITSARCAKTDHLNGYLIRGNINNAKTERGVRLNAKKVIVHPSYNSKTYSNDIALIEIDPNHSLTNFLKIDTKDHASSIINDLSFIMDGQELKATGWGDLKKPGSGEPKEVSMQVLGPETCSQYIKVLNTSTTFCTGTTEFESEPFFDEYGSPIVTPDFKTLVGISSFIPDNTNRFLNGYTRVSSFASWIQKYLK